jgi:hypothetical protein
MAYAAPLRHRCSPKGRSDALSFHVPCELELRN